MSLLRVVAGALVAALLGLTLTAGAAYPAAAAPTDLFGPITPGLAGDLAYREATGLEGYRVTVNAEQLTARGGTTERNAWSAQKGAMSAKDASRYAIRSTVGLEQGLGALDTIRPWAPGSPLIEGWRGKVPMPRYTGLGLANPSSLLLLPATLGWEYRGGMTDGVLNLAQLSSKDDSVCQQTYVYGAAAGFVNWLTDVDCEAWAVKQSFVPNEGIQAGFSSGLVCKPTDPAACISVSGLGNWDNTGATYSQYWGASGYQMPVVCMPYSGNFNVNLELQLKSGKVQSGALGPTGGGWGAFGPNACGTGAEDNKAWSGFSPQPVDMITGIRILGATTPFSPVSPTNMDPDRTRVCEQTGSDGQIYTGSTAPFTESDVAINGYPAFACAALPLGVTSNRLRLIERAAGQPDKILDDQVADATPQTDALLGGSTAKYCQTKVCISDLIIKSTGLSCFSQGETCLGWWEELNHGDAKYQCNYAGFNVAIADCALYAHIFDTQKRLAGNPYSDPVTGEEIGTQTGTSVDKNMMGGMPRASFSGRDCFGAGFGSANPLQWVLRPLQCFGEWAAVPRESVVQASAIHSQHAWDSTLLGKGPALVSQFGAIPAFTGCSGVPIDIDQTWPIPWGIHWRFGASCDGPLATAAAVSRLVLGGLIGAGGVLAIVTYISGGIGMRRFGRDS